MESHSAISGKAWLHFWVLVFVCLSFSHFPKCRTPSQGIVSGDSRERLLLSGQSGRSGGSTGLAREDPGLLTSAVVVVLQRQLSFYGRERRVRVRTGGAGEVTLVGLNSVCE